jgi:ribosomal protein S9
MIKELFNKKKLGIARALLKIVNDEEQKKLKISGMLSRNSLCKERRSLNCYL